jgi:cytochrome c oxidase cbb3-type subunit 1
MYSIKLINVHFWLATVGTVLYIVAMWISGVMQGLMWRAVNDDGTLTYSFVEALQAPIPSTSCASWVAASSSPACC